MLEKTQADSFVPASGHSGARWFLLVLVLLLAALLGAEKALAMDTGPEAEAPQAAEQEPEAGASGQSTRTRRGRIPKNPFPNRVKAPSLDGGTAWLNTSGEITLRDLRGKVVVLDFWTYCCINCMHVLPDLAYLEDKYAKQLVVIGVHSAKFDNEKDSENISRAIMRYEIKHPVINDSEMLLWRKFGARAWPTLVLIDPEGYYCGFISGEGHRKLLDGVIGRMVGYHRAKGTLDETPVQFALESEKLEPTSLKFPGKVLADEASNRLFISDSNHNRIVITDLDGRLLDVIGSGAIGNRNSSFEQASFDHPQGMALVGETLYIADTENHMIRVADLQARRVSKLSGTGEQARLQTQGGRLRSVALNSPWDLIHIKGRLYIAMAGPHQIWDHKLDSQTIQVFAGTGREDILNGPLRQAAFAQPSGMATDGKFLYVADSEGSAIRRISIDRSGGVATVVGTSELPNGRSLFEFGDVDGTGAQARLQHPLGVVYHDGILYVADSYNHKIKKVFLSGKDAAGRAETFLGTGKPGRSLDPPQFSEPGGLSLAAGRLYIADTNNHRICVADLATGEVSELTIAGLEPPQVQPSEEETLQASSGVQKLGPQRVGSGESLQFEIALDLPAGHKLNVQAPVLYKLKALGEQTLIEADQLEVRHKAESGESMARITVPLTGESGSAAYELSVIYTFCRDGVGGLCKLDTAHWHIPLEVTADASQNVIRLQTGSSR